LATKKVVSGSFDSLFIGQYSVTGVVMSRVTSVGTGGYKINYTVPRAKKVQATQSYPQSGMAKIEVDLSFLGDDQQGQKLAMGNWLTANVDDAPSGQQYTLLMVDSQNNGYSVYIPRCETETELSKVRAKGTAASIALKFRWEEPDTRIQLYRQGTSSYLSGIAASGTWPL